MSKHIFWIASYPKSGNTLVRAILSALFFSREGKFQLDQLILWDIDSNYVKVGSARLIELIRHDLQKYDNVSIYENHSLVLVTNAKATQEEVLNFAENIKDKVFEVFNISLEIEPTIILN